MTYWLIFLGSGIGGVCRFLLSRLSHNYFPSQFPLGTFMVNISGSFLMGLLYILLLQRAGQTAFELRAFLLVGLLGGYTTYSAFSLETLNLFERGAWLVALTNIGTTVTLGLLATFIGILLGRQL